MSSYLLLTTPGRQHAGPLLRAAQCGGAAGGLNAPSCGRLVKIKLVAGRGGPSFRPDTLTCVSVSVLHLNTWSWDWHLSVLLRLSPFLFYCMADSLRPRVSIFKNLASPRIEISLSDFEKISVASLGTYRVSSYLFFVLFVFVLRLGLSVALAALELT